MKKKFFVLLIALLAATCFMQTVSAFADENSAVRSLEVSGAACVFVEPECADLNFSVQAAAATVSEALSRVNEMIKAVAEKVKTVDSDAAVGENGYAYSYPSCEVPCCQIYCKSISVCTDKPELAENIISAAAETAQLGSVRYCVKDTAAAYAEALNAAKETAIKKAELLVGGLKLISIKENFVYCNSSPAANGKLLVEASVTATFTE